MHVTGGPAHCGSRWGRIQSVEAVLGEITLSIKWRRSREIPLSLCVSEEKYGGEGGNREGRCVQCWSLFAHSMHWSCLHFHRGSLQSHRGSWQTFADKGRQLSTHKMAGGTWPATLVACIQQ